MTTNQTDELRIVLGVDLNRLKAGFANGINESKKFFTKLEEHSAQFQKLTLVQGLAFGAQVLAIRGFVKEAAAAELAQQKLEASLKSEQRTREDSIPILNAQAKALQQVTQFSDDEITNLQATLGLYKLNDQQIEELTPSLLDVAAGMQKVTGETQDLATLGEAFGKAMNGNMGILARYGIVLSEETKKSGDFGLVLRDVQKQFAGMAVAMGDTTQGKMKQVANLVDDLKENIGAALLPTIRDLITIVAPVLKSMAQWVSEHQKLVLTIVGGGLAGSGVMAAISAMGLAIGGLVAVSGGPITLAIVGISTLVGLIVSLGLAQRQLPSSIDGVNKELEEQQKRLAGVNAEIEKLSAPSATGIPELDGGVANASRIADLAAQAAIASKRIEELTQAQKKLNQATAAGPIGGGGSSALGIDEEREKAIEEMRKRIEENAQKIRLAGSGRGAGEFGGDLFAPQENGIADAVIPEEQLALIDDRFQELRDKDQQVWAGITDHRSAFMKQQIDANAQHVVDFAFAWGDMFTQVLQTEKNFAVAFGKATVMGFVKVLGAEARKSIAEILLKKATELGKAAIGGPLSFGATLAATGPIIAAAAAALGVISSIESKFAKSMGGFEFGGVIPETAYHFMHAGEVAHNPRRNSLRDLASNLTRAGATEQARLVAVAAGGGAVAGGGGGVIANWNQYGPIQGPVDIREEFSRFARRIGRSLGADSG